MPTYREVSDPYAHFMRNMPHPQRGVCSTCSTFCTGHDECYACSHQWPHADAVLPISFSPHMGQLRSVLRQYKDATTPRERARLQRDLGAVLWRFLIAHEECLARACGVDQFGIVTTVPSSDPARDARHPLPDVVGRICRPTAGRYQRLLTRSSKSVPQRTVDPAKYTVVGDVKHRRVLLIDDTWTTGANAQSAAGTLQNRDAAKVGVVIGRHLHESFADHGGRLRALPRMFVWTDCALH